MSPGYLLISPLAESARQVVSGLSWEIVANDWIRGGAAGKKTFKAGVGGDGGCGGSRSLSRSLSRESSSSSFGISGSRPTSVSLGAAATAAAAAAVPVGGRPPLPPPRTSGTGSHLGQSSCSLSGIPNLPGMQPPPSRRRVSVGGPGMAGGQARASGSGVNYSAYGDESFNLSDSDIPDPLEVGVLNAQL